MAIAEKYGVTPGAITQFADRYADEIAAVRADMDNEFAGILIAQKATRLAMYEEIAERALEPTPKIDNKGNQVVDRATGELVYEFDGRLAAQVAKQAAEEMGQLPTRVQVTGDMNTTTKYIVEGVDPGALQ